MSWSLFLDDEREPPHHGQSWKIARDYEEAMALINELGCPSFISFDHDLGPESLTGYDLAKNIVEFDLNCKMTFLPEDFTFDIHSQNPVGSQNILMLLNGYLKYRKS